MAGGRMHAPHPTPRIRPRPLTTETIKSLAYFSHLAPLILFFLLKGRVKSDGAWPNRTQTHLRRHKHTARENQRYRSSAVKLASSYHTPRSLFSHPHFGTAALRPMYAVYTDNKSFTITTIGNISSNTCSNSN